MTFEKYSKDFVPYLLLAILCIGLITFAIIINSLLREDQLRSECFIEIAKEKCNIKGESFIRLEIYTSVIPNYYCVDINNKVSGYVFEDYEIDRCDDNER